MNFELKASHRGNLDDPIEPGFGGHGLELIQKSGDKFAALSEKFNFQYFHILDLNNTVAGKTQPTTLLSNFADTYLFKTLALGNMADCTLYRVLEKTVVSFGWQVGTDNSAMTNRSEAAKIADDQFFNLLGEIGIKCAYSVPVSNAQGGRAVVNYYETTGRAAKHYPQMILETASLFERSFDIIKPNDQISSLHLNDLQKKCLAMLAAGIGPGEMQLELKLSQHTINAIVQSAVENLDANSVTHAAVLALSNGLIDSPG